MRGSVFGRTEAFNVSGLVYYKFMISTPCRKTREVVVPTLLVGTVAVKITKYKLIHILQQSVVTGREGVSIQ